MVKKQKKHVLRPWCWYCERDFEDEKVLMQHQKAKHFKCGHCPRKLNTAGGLAVHIQQVHKLDPEPIENALEGRQGYDVEIFGMEGVPAPDVAAYKRRKEQDLGLPPGTFGHTPGTAPPAAKKTYENRVYTYEELKVLLDTHKALMGRGDDTADKVPDGGGAVVHAAPQTYALPPVPPPMAAPGVPLPSMFPPPHLMHPPGGAFPPFPPGAFPPGAMPPFPPPGFSLPPPSARLPPPAAALAGAPALPPPPFEAQQQAQQHAQAQPQPQYPGPSTLSKPPPPMNQAPQQSQSPRKPLVASKVPAPGDPFDPVAHGLKENTSLKWTDLDASPIERRAEDPKYTAGLAGSQDIEMSDGTGGSQNRKRKRAEDFLD